ncbi:MAG: hisS [Candidatus Magasanikbacteria bacterium]|nr:hisS [Candidatus Magasanikbacteria bacterium]
MKKPEAPKEPYKSTKKTPQLLRGMRDTLPKDDKYWRAVYGKAQELADAYGFGRIDTPILEEASLFTRAVGRQTDIVEKEMYVFEDKDGEKISLRPEATASVVRAYIQHGMLNLPQPVKLWYWGPMFRHDRPQAGRFRQFTQAGYEIIGDDSPVADAQVILVAYKFYTELGLPVNVQLNSIGTAEDRTRYKVELVNYYRANRSKLCDNCKVRLVKNPMRLLDCKEEGCQPIKENAPRILEFLAEESRKHFMSLLEYLDELSIPYFLNHTLVRGLDYYTKTVFEIWPEPFTPKAEPVAPVDAGPGAVLSVSGAVADETPIVIKEKEPKEAEEAKMPAQVALCGGGRYDLLVEELGGRPTPACGVAPGIERAVQQLRMRQLAVPEINKHELFVAQLGELAKRKALVLFEMLRLEKIPAAEAFSKGSLKFQLEAANEKKIPYALIIGQKEVIDKTVIIRDMDSGIQETVDFQKVVSAVKRKIGRE